MKKKIAILPGDGIGPEITAEAVKVFDRVADVFGHQFEYTYVEIGGCSIDRFGVPITEENMQLCKQSDSILLGAVGGPKWDNCPPSIRPEKALLAVRKELDLFANLRPTKLFAQLADASPLKHEIVGNGIDLLIVRELTGGVYFGEHKTEESCGEVVATDIMQYSEHEIERIGRVAFETARKRGTKLASVDKANVLDTSRLWRKVMHRLAEEYPDVTYSDILVDNTAMQLIKDPTQFDVIVTENMFGDILSDEASMLTGSIGMMPSASLSAGTRGMYEPIHGSAPDIAGKNIANPIGTILSAAMMLRYSFDMQKEADAIEQAVSKVLDLGYRTADIMQDGCTLVSCSEMGDFIAENIEESAIFELTVKPMQTEDEIDGKGYVHYKSWQETYVGLIDAEYLRNITEEKCKAMAHKWTDNILVAKDGDKVIGFVAYGKYRDDTLSDCGEVFAIYVLADYQGKKVGYELMNAAFEKLAAYDKIAVWVLKGNEQAIKFYERYGFRFDGTELEVMLGTPNTELRMVYTRS